MYQTKTAVLALCLGVLPAAGAAQGVYQTAADFVAASFSGDPPEPRVQWITGALRNKAAKAFSGPPPMLRVRYWQRGGRTAWVLEAVGKERPITAGFVVEGGRIGGARVLVFPESRGDEIRHPAFTRQFTGARLSEGVRLNRELDGITGATLSVRAMERMARLALLLHKEVTGE